MKVLVCGGRYYEDQAELNLWLNIMKMVFGMTMIIEGEAKGADKMAGEWGVLNRVSVEKFPADWDKYGNAAGHIRNQQMLDEGKPNLILAFPGNRGTNDMISRAKIHHIPLINLGRPPGTWNEQIQKAWKQLVDKEKTKT